MADDAQAAANTPTDGPAAETKPCANCGSPMDPRQDWCLQCGAGTSESLLGSSVGWRSPAVLLVATAALVLGAAAASYAAWGKSSTTPPVLTTTVAQAPAPTTTAPSVTEGPATTTPVKPAKAKLPKIVKPPKIPLTAVTPKTVTKTTATVAPASEVTSTVTTTTTTSEALPEPILLDTNAASTYDPNGYPASEFGDPTLAIDGDTSTGWSAEVNPALAPKLEAGVLIDLKTPQKISSAELISATPGLTVQLYGANPAAGETTAPALISNPAWVKLSKTVVAKNRHEHIKFLRPLKAYRFIVLWIRDVPASAVGTAEAPGHVFVNELELFPPTE